jgi:hypothetical protein
MALINSNDTHTPAVSAGPDNVPGKARCLKVTTHTAALRHSPLSLNNANSTSSARRSLAIVNSLRAFSNISCVATLLDYTHWLALIMHSGTHTTLAFLDGNARARELCLQICTLAFGREDARASPKGSPLQSALPPVSSSAHNLLDPLRIFHQSKRRLRQSNSPAVERIV